MKRKTLALPLRVVDFSNTSQIVSLFTRESGLVEGIAKGAYRERSSFQTPFDLAVLHEVVFVEKMSGLAILTEASVVEGFRGLRRSWKRHLAASHVLEFLRAVATAGEPDGPLFDCSVETFHLLAVAGDFQTGACLARFEARALSLLGLLSSMESCVRCGRRWPGGSQSVLVSPRSGGIVCRRCRTADESAGGLLVPGGALELLLRLLALEGAEMLEADAEARWKAHGARVFRVLSELRAHLIDRELVVLTQGRKWS